MTAEEIYKAAAGDRVPDGLDCAERCLFWELRDLVRRFKLGEINKADAGKRKAEAFRQFEVDKSELKRGQDICLLHARMWKDIEAAGNRYRKEPSISNADAFIEAVYGVTRKEVRTDG